MAARNLGTGSLRLLFVPLCIRPRHDPAGAYGGLSPRVNLVANVIRGVPSVQDCQKHVRGKGGYPYGRQALYRRTRIERNCGRDRLESRPHTLPDGGTGSANDFFYSSVFFVASGALIC